VSCLQDSERVAELRWNYYGTWQGVADDLCICFFYLLIESLQYFGEQRLQTDLLYDRSDATCASDNKSSDHLLHTDG